MHVPRACLQVGEAGHDDIHIEHCAVYGGLYEVGQVAASVLQGAVEPQPRVCCHLSAHAITCQYGPLSKFEHPAVLREFSNLVLLYSVKATKSRGHLKGPNKNLP